MKLKILVVRSLAASVLLIVAPMVALVAKAESKDIAAPGEACADAVPVKSIAEERTWIGSRFPNYKLVQQGLWGSEDGRRFDVIEFLTKDGLSKSQCFDITSFFGGGKYASKVRKRLSRTELTPYVQALKSGDKSVRQDAIYRLSYVNEEATEDAHEALISAMRDVDFDNAREAIVKVGKHRPADAVSPLIELLRSADQEKAGIAAHELRELGDAAKPAIPDLEPLLSSARSRTRSAAAQTLDRLGVRSRRIIEVFESLLLRDTIMWVRQEMAYALRDHEHLGAPVIAMLEKATADAEGYVVESACFALRRFKTPEGKAALVRSMRACTAVGSKRLGE